jgi:hypothetical protein
MTEEVILKVILDDVFYVEILQHLFFVPFVVRSVLCDPKNMEHKEHKEDTKFTKCSGNSKSSFLCALRGS